MNKRVFVYDNRQFSDPDSTLTVEQVKQNFQAFFPELATATVKESKDPKDPETTIYQFTRQTGTKGSKGADDPMDGHATMEAPMRWEMPGWMEKYLPLMDTQDKRALEGLMDDHHTNLSVNPVRAMKIISAGSQIMLLQNLKKQGFLSKEVA